LSRKFTILLIDDNDDSLDLLEVFLYSDYELWTAQNGFEGLQIAEREDIDLIITDIMMPTMDGIRLFNELKRRDHTKNIPVIAITSFIETTTISSLKNIGFNNVIPKPFTNETINEAIRSILDETELEGLPVSEE